MLERDPGGISTKEPSASTGIVQEVLPNALFKVRLDDGRMVTANLSDSLRHRVVRLIQGDRVLVQPSKHDPHRGRVTEKL